MKNSLARRSETQLILEGIVTTQNEDNTVNISPMGPVVDRELGALRFRPFKSSTTYKNLKRSRQGIFHVTDDAEQLAKAVVGRADELPIRMIDDVGFALEGVCYWLAFEVEGMDETQDRVEIHCHVAHRETKRPFLGWNRAMHSVVEAAILATRVKILPRQDIEAQLDALETIVDKTASAKERRAFGMLRNYVREQ